MKQDSLQKSLRRMGIFLTVISATILVGYIASFRPVMAEKEHYVKAVGRLTLLDAIDTIDKDILDRLINLVVHPQESKYRENLLQSAEDLKLALKDALDFSGREDITEHLKKAQDVTASTLLPALKRLVERKYSVGDEDNQKNLESLLAARTDFNLWIEKAKSRAVLETKISGARQSQALNNSSMVLGLTLFLSISFLTINFRRLSKSTWLILSRLNDQLSDSIGKITSATETIDAASKQVSRSATQNAAAIEETAASMEEVNAMIAHSAQNATSSLELSRVSQRQVEKGKEIMDQMTSSMAQIQIANSKLENILQIIIEIGNKTKVINDIVFETRLLSFNAAIEAARAGTFGKGFTVVAEEIGKLATVSGSAASEIRLLLESSTSEVRGIVKDTQERVTRAKEVMERCNSTFRLMANDLFTIGDAMERITNASKEQEVGVRETKRAVTEISDTTNKNSNSAEVLAGQVSSLSHQILSITNLIADLRSFLYGSGPSTRKKNSLDKIK